MNGIKSNEELRELALAATPALNGEWLPGFAVSVPEGYAFIDAFNPPTALALVDRAERLEKALRAARDTFKVEYAADGTPAGVSYGSEVLRPLIVMLDAALNLSEET